MRSAPSTDETALRNRILQAESDLETAVSAEQKARRDYQLADDERKNANRRLITMDENLKAAQRRIAELEALALRAGSVPSPTVGPRPSSPTDLVVQQGLRTRWLACNRNSLKQGGGSTHGSSFGINRPAGEPGLERSCGGATQNRRFAG